MFEETSVTGSIEYLEVFERFWSLFNTQLKVILNSESTDWSMIVEHVIAKRVPSNRASFCMGLVDKVMFGSGTAKTS